MAENALAKTPTVTALSVREHHLLKNEINSCSRICHQSYPENLFIEYFLHVCVHTSEDKTAEKLCRGAGGLTQVQWGRWGPITSAPSVPAARSTPLALSYSTRIKFIVSAEQYEEAG